jgi:hypothetical protein
VVPAAIWAGEAVLRLHLVHPLAERADDPPTADVGPGRDCQSRRDLHPVRDVEARDRAVRVEGECNDAHSLLRVVGAVREGDPGAGEELAGTESPVGEAGGEPVKEPVDEDEEGERSGETDYG